MSISRKQLTLIICLLASFQLRAEISSENAVWEVFTNREEVSAFAISKDKKTLWVGTNGGLEKRNLSTGELEQIYTTAEGLPSNDIRTFLPDEQGGLWIGTADGLAHLKKTGSWEVFKTNNSKLPHNSVYALSSDTEKGLWIGTSDGLAHLKADETWAVFNTHNANLPHNHINALLSDDQGGVWIGALGLAHLNKTGDLQAVLTQDNANLPSNVIWALHSDEQGGILIGTDAGLAHLKADNTWQLFNPDNSKLPYHDVITLLSDKQGGVWIGTTDGVNGGGLAHLKADGSWAILNSTDSNLPNNWVKALISDPQGGIWIGTSSGFAHLKKNRLWEVFNTNSSNLADNWIEALLSDQQGGVWVGSLSGGLNHLNKTWQVLNTDNLPSNSVRALLSDQQGGMWIGTDGGLAHLKKAGSWQVLNTDHSKLPSDYVRSLLLDEEGGIWIGTRMGGLAHFKKDDSWEVFNTDNSDLPSNYVEALLSDEQGGLFIATYRGLSHLKPDGAWEIFNTDNSNLPANYVEALLTHEQGGIWIGTRSGLAHFKTDGTWHIWNTDNSNLPHNWIKALLSDDQGGIWSGTKQGGLAHLKADNTWEVFNEDNSNLPHNEIEALSSDQQNGVWIGTGGGLAHLTFGQKSTLCTHIDQADCDEVITAKRAAILIHPNGSGSGSNQALAIDFMATYVYHSLQARGYDHDEIYFLSHKPDLDFNDDAQADFNLIDAPITLAALRKGTHRPRDITLNDIKNAFDWAKAKGKLEHPLILIFIDHGWPKELLLNPLGSETLTAETFKALLDDYQNSTHNEVIVILEACHSGTFLPTLSAPNRLIISSTDEQLAYFSDNGRTSFLKLYFDNLRQGEKFGQSLKQVTEIIATYSSPLNQQRPQLNDNPLQNLCLNGCWGSLPGVLKLTITKLPPIVPLGQPIDLTAETISSDIDVPQVWASLITPEIAHQRNEQGYSLQPTPFLPFTFQPINTRKQVKTWQARFSELTIPGDYVLTFKAKDHKGFITDAPPMIFTVVGDGLTHARFDSTTQMLHMPAITVGTEIYQADLILRQAEPEFILEVDMKSLKLIDDSTSLAYSNFNPNTGTMHIPLLEVPNTTGGIDRYRVNLQLQAQASPLQFKIVQIIPFSD